MNSRFEQMRSQTRGTGSEYSMFDGELLDERRRRMEAEKFDATEQENS